MTKNKINKNTIKLVLLCKSMTKNKLILVAFSLIINSININASNWHFTDSQSSVVFTSVVGYYCENNRVPSVSRVVEDTGLPADTVRCIGAAHQLQVHALANAYGSTHSNAAQAIASLQGRGDEAESIAEHAVLLNRFGNNCKHCW